MPKLEAKTIVRFNEADADHKRTGLIAGTKALKMKPWMVMGAQARDAPGKSAPVTLEAVQWSLMATMVMQKRHSVSQRGKFPFYPSTAELHGRIRQKSEKKLKVIFVRRQTPPWLLLWHKSKHKDGKVQIAAETPWVVVCNMLTLSPASDCGGRPFMKRMTTRLSDDGDAVEQQGMPGWN